MLEKTPTVKLHQIEITTRCNFSCYYCAGRHMPQQDMPWERFTSIVDSIATESVTISLQGEGEPSLHPRFFDMARYVRARGHEPYTILNGSRMDVQQLSECFPTLAISLDTLDEQFAERVGRHNLAKVLTNIDTLLQNMSPRRVIIMTVDMGQPLGALRDYVQKRQFALHIVQPLQPKDDYAGYYPIPVRVTNRRSGQSQRCSFVDHPRMRFHNLEGLALPCCFMKNTSDFVSIDQLRDDLAEGKPVAGCLGCLHLQPMHGSCE